MVEKEWREPTTRSLGEEATTSRSSAIVCGAITAAGEKETFFAQLGKGAGGSVCRLWRYASAQRVAAPKTTVSIVQRPAAYCY